MNLKKSPIGSFWFGIKVMTVMTSAALFWVCLIGAGIVLYYNLYWPSIILLLASVGFSAFSQSLEGSIIKEELKEKEEAEREDDDDLTPPPGMKFS